MDKKSARIRRATRARRKLQELGATRLVVHRTPRHIYAQVIAPNGSEVLVAASTVEKAIAEQLKYTVTKTLQQLWVKLSLNALWKKASKMFPLTVPGSNIMVVSRHWQMLPVKLAFSSKVEV